MAPSSNASSTFNADANAFEPSDNFIPSPCVWVGNVCPIVTESDLRRVFSPFGDIRLLRVFPKSKCAFVTFSTSEQAMASAVVEGTLLGTMNLTLNVGRASRHLWVGNIGLQISEDRLYSMFAEVKQNSHSDNFSDVISQFGEVESIRILRNNRSAFVNMRQEKHALQAAQSLNGCILGRDKITINFQWEEHRSYVMDNSAGSGQQSGSDSSQLEISDNSLLSSGGFDNQFDCPSRQLFIGNIDPSISQSVLLSLFHQFGQVEHIKRFVDRCYAFVIYVNISDAIWCREQLALFPPVIRGRTLIVNYGKTTMSWNTSRSRGQRSLEMRTRTRTYYYYPPITDGFEFDPFEGAQPVLYTGNEYENGTIYDDERTENQEPSNSSCEDAQKGAGKS